MPNHFLSTQDLSCTQIHALLDTAENYLHSPPLPTLSGQWVATVFFEPSTRTRCSFTMAARRLGAEVLPLDVTYSSMQKGEAIVDLFANLQAMGCDQFVIRHGENGMLRQIADYCQTARVINAGEGSNEHPTQALLDMLTIRRHKANFTDLTVAIVGDVLHSRVARSDLFTLHTLGVKEIRLIAPSCLLPNDSEQFNAVVFDNLAEGLANVDVIITLRLQKERMRGVEAFDVEAFVNAYQINSKTLRLAKPDVMVMHPGPLNRGIELTSEVADGPHSVILEQVKCGVAVRMAVLSC